MKITSPEFRTHLDRDVTALCTCWRIERTDGKVLFFTDSDQDVAVAGDVYESIGAYSRSAIETTSNLSVDNLEIAGLANELSLPVEELRAGVYDHAEVKIFMTSWMNPEVGQIKLRRGFFGEVQVLPNDTFTVELRGLLQRLAHTYTDVYSTTCRHDLGDGATKELGCNVNLTHPFVTEGAHIPVPFSDPGFEEAGSVGMVGSTVWYNPINSEDLVSSVDSFTGTYSAFGGAGGGSVTQDTSLFEMGEDFLWHVDNRQVTFTGYTYRKDDGDEGRIRFQFLDADLRELRFGGFASTDNQAISVGVVEAPADFTVETWVRVNSNRFISTLRVDFVRHTNAPQRRFNYFNGAFNYGNSAASVFGDFNFAYPLEYGVWYHVALSLEGTHLKLYVNGVLIAEDPTFEDSAAPNDPITGITTQFIGDSFGAEIDWDEYRVWSVARTRSQIVGNMYRDLPAGDPDLLLYYPFDGDNTDYGAESTGDITYTGSISAAYSPVAVSYRGTPTGYNSGFQNTGATWTLESAGEDLPIPPHTRYLKTTFDHTSVAGTPEGTRFDSLFGWFEDSANTTLMPNFSVGNTPAVWTRAGMVTASNDNRVFFATIDEPRAQDAWFQGGLVTFYSGKNAGGSMEVKTWTQSTGEMALFLSMPYPIEPGDLFTVYPGCDKTRINCRAVFNNMDDFYGFPDIPGEDELFRYPDAKE